MSSVLQDWVMHLTLREQGTILAAVRGCDLAPKSAAANERQLVAYLRWVALVPADPREVNIEGAFMQDHPPRSWRASEFGHYPQHWYAHLMHAFEVVAYRHPYDTERANARYIYQKFATNLHLNPEPREVFILRMTEDRIANNTVVS